MLIPGILPPRARAKLARWTAALDDGNALVSAIRERRDAAENAEALAARRLAAARKDVHADPKHIARLEAEAEAAEAAVDRCRNEGAQRVRERDRSRLIAETALEFLRMIGSSGPVDLEEGPRWIDAQPDVALKDGETYEEAVTAVRRQIYGLQSAIAQLKAAPLPAEQIRQIVTDEIHRLANAGRPRLDIANGQVKIGWADNSTYTLHAPAKGATAMLCWLHRDFFIEALTRNIDQIKGGIPLADREPREMELKAKVRELELREEALICAAEEAGVVIDRRGGIEADILLLLAPKPFETELLAAAE